MFGASNVGSKSFQVRSSLHLSRRFWHVGTGLLGLYLYGNSRLSQSAMANFLIGLALLAFLVEFARLRMPWLNQIILRLFLPFLRESERQQISGFPFYALGSGLTLFFFSEQIAILAILFLVLGDPISASVGTVYGKDKILPNKSLQGCVACFATCYLLTLFYCLAYSSGGPLVIVFSCLAGLVGCLAELTSFAVDDNLSMPVLSGLGLTLLNQVFGLL